MHASREVVEKLRWIPASLTARRPVSTQQLPCDMTGALGVRSGQRDAARLDMRRRGDTSLSGVYVCVSRRRWCESVVCAAAEPRNRVVHNERTRRNFRMTCVAVGE